MNPTWTWWQEEVVEDHEDYNGCQVEVSQVEKRGIIGKPNQFDQGNITKVLNVFNNDMHKQGVQEPRKTSWFDEKATT